MLRWFTRPQTVTHPSTNRARRRVTTLIETNALLLSAKPGHHTPHMTLCISRHEDCVRVSGDSVGGVVVGTVPTLRCPVEPPNGIIAAVRCRRPSGSLWRTSGALGPRLGNFRFYWLLGGNREDRRTPCALGHAHSTGSDDKVQSTASRPCRVCLPQGDRSV